VPEFLPLDTFHEYPPDEMASRAAAFYATAQRRRSVRDFSNRQVPKSIIEDCLRAAGTAPSGANQQPWRFVAVSDPAVRHQIRVEAEREERAFYNRRAPADWLQALAPLGTDAEKPFLDIAPWLIVIFVKSHSLSGDGQRVKHYYAQESVGIATGMLISALHYSGLATLTHTPSPMGFLNDLLGRPANERPFLNLVVGYPADNVTVPAIRRKTLEEIATFI